MLRQYTLNNHMVPKVMLTTLYKERLCFFQNPLENWRLFAWQPRSRPRWHSVLCCGKAAKGSVHKWRHLLGRGSPKGDARWHGGGRGLSKSDVTSKCLKKRMNSIIFYFDNIKIKLSDIFMATKQQKKISEGGRGHQKVTSLLRWGHRKVTSGDKGGGGTQKSQNGGDIIYGWSLISLSTIIIL